MSIAFFMLLAVNFTAENWPDCSRPACSRADMEASHKVCCLAYPCLLDDDVRKDWEQRALRGEYSYSEVLFFHYLERKDEASALPWMRLAAEQDYPHGQFFYGQHLAKTFPLDPEMQAEALAWMEKAALAPSRTFSAELSRHHLRNGNRPEARRWMERAARLGDEHAVRELIALLAEDGDLELSCLWSVASSDPEAAGFQTNPEESPACDSQHSKARAAELRREAEKLKNDLNASEMRYMEDSREVCSAWEAKKYEFERDLH